MNQNDIAFADFINKIRVLEELLNHNMTTKILLFDLMC